MKPGYLLKITSWENDADNYNTKEMSGLTRSEVIFMLDVLQLFKSTYNGGKYGNRDVVWDEDTTRRGRRTDAEMPEDILYITKKHINYGGDVPAAWDPREWAKEEYYEEGHARDYYSDLLYDIGLGTWCDGEFRRVFEDFEVILIPDVEIKNVTDEFKTLLQCTVR